MSREVRLEFQGATHVVNMTGRPRCEIFFASSILKKHLSSAEQVPGIKHFESLLSEACDAYGAIIHAYAIEPNFTQLVIRTNWAPLEWVLRDIRGRYSRYAHREALTPGPSAFQGRYKSKVLDPALLPYAARFAHQHPVAVAGVCDRVDDYPFSSYRSYLNGNGPKWLNRETLVGALEQRGYFGRKGIQDFSRQPTSKHLTELFAHGFPLNINVIGDKVFAQYARHRARQCRWAPARDELICAAANALGTRPERIATRTHVGSLGRSLVAWYAGRSGAAHRAEVGRWFGVTGSALRHAIDTHRRTSAALFEFGIEEFLGSSTSHADSRNPDHYIAELDIEGSMASLPPANIGVQNSDV